MTRWRHKNKLGSAQETIAKRLARSLTCKRPGSERNELHCGQRLEMNLRLATFYFHLNRHTCAQSNFPKHQGEPLLLLRQRILQGDYHSNNQRKCIHTYQAVILTSIKYYLLVLHSNRKLRFDCKDKVSLNQNKHVVINHLSGSFTYCKGHFKIVRSLAFLGILVWKRRNEKSNALPVTK